MSTIVPVGSANRIGSPEPVIKPGRF